MSGRRRRECGHLLYRPAGSALETASEWGASDTESDETSSLPAGVFVVFGSCVGVAVLISFGEACLLQRRKRARRKLMRRADTDDGGRGVMTDTELMREMMKEID